MLRYDRGAYVESSCSNCEFNAGCVCMGNGIMPDGTYTYGRNLEEVEKKFPDGCRDWGLSFSAFEEWNSDEYADTRYITAVRVYSEIISYAEEHSLTTVEAIKESLQDDRNLTEETRTVYMERLKAVSDDARKVFMGKGIMLF